MRAGGRPARRVVVIGAGLAGLAAATTLRAAGIDVIVLEREAQVGGRVRTVRIDGAPVDVGAQFVATFSREVLDVVRTAGLEPHFHKRSQHAQVVHRGRGWPVESAGQLARTGLMPLTSRLRLLLLALPMLAGWRDLDPDDLLSAARLDDDDADHFVRRWCGPDVTERFVGPIVRGLLFWDLPTTSRAMLMVMLRTALRSREVFRPDAGLELLPLAMAQGLDVRTSRPATSLHHHPDGTWTIETRGPDSPGADALHADGVLCCTTASVAAALCPDPIVAARLRAVSYARTIGIIYRIERPLRPPPTTQLFTGASSELLASVGSPAADVPHDATLASVYLAGSGVDRWDALPDQQLAHAALAAATVAGGDTAWTAAATAVHVCRWPEALPRFEAGALREAARRGPGALDVGSLAFAGDYIGGPFLEGALRSGRRAAARLLTKI